MESEFKNLGRHEDHIDLEVKKLIEEVEEHERTRRAVIEMLMTLGSDVVLEPDV